MCEQPGYLPGHDDTGREKPLPAGADPRHGQDAIDEASDAMFVPLDQKPPPQELDQGDIGDENDAQPDSKASIKAAWDHLTGTVGRRCLADMVP